MRKWKGEGGMRSTRNVIADTQQIHNKDNVEN
jgi:hypothetical protein